MFNLGTVLAGAIFQPAIGALLDRAAPPEDDGGAADGARPPARAYRAALAVIPACYAACFLLIALGFPADELDRAAEEDAAAAAASEEHARPASVEVELWRAGAKGDEARAGEIRCRS